MTKEEFSEISKMYQETLQKVDTLNASEIYQSNLLLTQKIDDLIRNLNILSQPLVDLNPWIFDENGKIKEEHLLKENQERLDKVIVCYLINAQNRQMEYIKNWQEEIKSELDVSNNLRLETRKELEQLASLYNRLVIRIPEIEKLLEK